MTILTGTLLLEQLFKGDKTSVSPQPRSPESPRRKRSLLRMRQLMQAICDLEESCDSSSVQLAQHLWLQLQDDIETDEDYSWLLDQVDYDACNQSMEEATFDSDKIQYLLAVPNLEVSSYGEQPLCINNEEKDPEMGVPVQHASVAPLSLQRFASVHELSELQQEQLVVNIARMASCVGGDKQSTSPQRLCQAPTKDLTTFRQQNQVNPQNRRRSWRQSAAIVCSLSLLVAGANVLMTIQLSSQTQVTWPWWQWYRRQKQNPQGSLARRILSATAQLVSHKESSISTKCDTSRRAHGEAGNDPLEHRHHKMWSDESTIGERHSTHTVLIPTDKEPVSNVTAENDDRLDGTDELNIKLSATFHNVHYPSTQITSPIHGAKRDIRDCTDQNIHSFAHWGDLDRLRQCLSLHPEWVNHLDENLWTVMHEAAASGWLDVVKYLVQTGACLSAVNNAGQTPSEVALLDHGKEHEVTKFLQRYETKSLDSMRARMYGIDSSCNIHTETANSNSSAVDGNQTKLHLASSDFELSATNHSIDCTSPRVVNVLVPETEGLYSGHQSSHESAACTRDHINWLIYFGHVVELQHCFSRHPEYVHRVDDLGWNPLHEAARASHSRVVAYLLQIGANAAALTKDGQSAWDIAVERHGKEHAVTKVLQEYRGDVATNVQMDNSKTDPFQPVHIDSRKVAEEANDLRHLTKVDATFADVIPEITHEDATTNSLQEGNDCLLFDFLWSASRGEVDKVKNCLSMHPDFVDQTDENGWTAIHEASRMRHVTTVEYLLHAGANVNLLTTYGQQSPLDVARQNQGDDHPVTLLLQSAMLES